MSMLNKTLKNLDIAKKEVTDGDLAVFSPIDGSKIAAVKKHTKAQTNAAIKRANKAFLEWRNVPAPRRGELVRLLGEELRKSKEDLGRLVSIENGKIFQDFPIL